MIKIFIKDNQITPESEALLNATVNSALPVGFPFNIDSQNIHWHLSYLLGTSLSILVPVIHGVIDDSDMAPTIAKPKFVIHPEDDFLELVTMELDGPRFKTPIVYRMTPLSEVYILSKLEVNNPGNTREPHSQLSACSKLIQEMYSDIPGYNVEESQIPKVFFTKFDLDFYLANLAVTLEESILLWMESTGKLSVNMNDESINMPRLLEKSIKRVFMFGPARNKVKVEFNNGDKKDFSQMTPSAQVEICSEILSILPE